MYTEMALTARRFALTLAVAGMAAIGSVAVAPAASAAQDGPASVVHSNGSNGPDAFILLEHGVKPVFFCDPANEHKQQPICTKVDGDRRF